MKELKNAIYDITKKLYDSDGGGSVSKVYRYAIENNLNWLFCTECEDDTPTFENDKICLVCWSPQVERLNIENYNNKDMKNELTLNQIQRQNFVDNEIFNLVKRLIPEKYDIELDWNIQWISDLRINIENKIIEILEIDNNIDKFEMEFYPFLNEEKEKIN